MFRKKRVRIAYHTKARLSKSINMLLVITMLGGMIFPIAGQAYAADANLAMSQNEQCVAPDRAEGGLSMIFLPLIGNIFQSAKAFMVGEQVGDVVAVGTPEVDPLNDIDFWNEKLATRTLNYEVGKTYVYLYDFTLESQNFGRTAQGTETARGQFMRLNSYVDMTILSKDASGAVAAEVSLRDPFVCVTTGTNEQSTIEDQATLDALATPLRFTQSANGTISDIQTVADLPISVKNMHKGIINLLQVTIQPSGDQYVAPELGLQGEYNANYQLEEKEDGLHISKTMSQSDYTTLIAVGERPESLLMDAQINYVLGDEHQVLSSVEMASNNQSSDGTKDNPTNEGKGIAGLSVWSSSTTSGSMKLQEVVDAPAGRNTRAVEALYQVDSFGGDLSEIKHGESGIDLSKVNLDAEFDTFEADPTDPAHFLRILSLTKADGGEVVVDKIGERLAQNIADPVLSNAYIDFLGTVGTPKAQDYLNGLFNNAQVRSANIAASSTITNQQQALFNMVTLTEPVSNTVDTLQGLSFGEETELTSTAQKVLSSAVNELEDDALAEELLGDLLVELDQAADVDELIDVLYAIGNLGLESSLDTLTEYITGTIIIDGNEVTDDYDLLDINAAAYDAMVDIPGQAAEDILIDALLNDDLDDWLWEIIVDILLDRDIYEDTALSDEAYDLLMDFLDGWYDDTEVGFPRAPEGVESEFRRNWNWALGGEKMGIRTPGSYYVANQPQSSQYGGGIYLYAQQAVNAYVMNPNDNFSIASASVTSRRSGANQEFSARVSIANNLINVQRAVLATCSSPNQSFELLNQYFMFFSYEYSLFELTGIPLSLQFEAGGTLKLTAFFGSNTCPGTDPNIYAGIEPRAEVDIIGRMYFDVNVITAGVEIHGKLASTGFPITATLSSINNESVLQACLDVKSVTDPLSFAVRIYAEIVGERIAELELVNYNVPVQFTAELLKICTSKSDGTERLVDGFWGGVNFFGPTNECNKFPGGLEGYQLSTSHWQSDPSAPSDAKLISMCRTNGFPEKEASYLLAGNVAECGVNSNRLGYIPASAFTNGSADAAGGMTLCQIDNDYGPNESLNGAAVYYLTPNLMNACAAGHSFTGHIFPDKFVENPKGLRTWNHFGMTVCKR